MKSFFVAISLLLSVTAWPQTGIGFTLGNPIGLNGKHWLNNSQAVDAGVGFSVFGKSHLQIHSDYLLHNESAFYFNDTYPLDLAFGIGGRMEFGDDIVIGARVPVGLVHKLERENADVFAEVAPILDFIGKTGLEIHLLFGARYYFQ